MRMVETKPPVGSPKARIKRVRFASLAGALLEEAAAGGVACAHEDQAEATPVRMERVAAASQRFPSEYVNAAIREM